MGGWPHTVAFGLSGALVLAGVYLLVVCGAWWVVLWWKTGHSDHARSEWTDQLICKPLTGKKKTVIKLRTKLLDLWALMLNVISDITILYIHIHCSIMESTRLTLLITAHLALRMVLIKCQQIGKYSIMFPFIAISIIESIWWMNENLHYYSLLAFLLRSSVEIYSYRFNIWYILYLRTTY